jgi:DNA-directed RNA polymerase subunit beta'
MAVHVPLSAEAQAEARILMLAAQNILNPKDGKPVVTPSQDMVLGNYYISMERAGAPGEGSVFHSPAEAISAYHNGYVHLHTRIAIKASSLNKASFTEKQQQALLVTTVGKIIFNEILPESFPYINEPTKENLQHNTPDRYFIYEKGTNVKEFIAKQPLVPPFKKSFLGDIIAEVFKRYQITETSKMLDRLKDLGFAYSTKAGITISIADIVVLEEKKEILERAEQEVALVTKQFRRGLITEEERYDKVISIWSKAKDEIQDKLMKSLDSLNPIFMMADSGARGNASNFTQLAGMRGLMANPAGRIIELPIKSSFREGLTVLEYFISTHGARKGLADTALKTADSGYLTRRLVDVAQDVIVREEDCGTDQGVDVTALTDGREVIETLAERIIGRVAFETLRHPETGEVLVRPNELITEDIAQNIEKAGISSVRIRSVFTCRTKHGVCQKCYGRNLATGNMVEIGEAVGIIAAQSIGEPGTQLTMRTFHTGGVAGDDITQGLPRVQELFEARNPKGQAVISEVDGEVIDIKEVKDRREILVQGEVEVRSYPVPYGSRLKVGVGDKVTAGQDLTEGSVDPKELLKVQGVRGVQSYLLKEVQKVYRMQGVEIGDKHIEVMVRQMLRKVRITDPGDTDLLPGAIIDICDYEEANTAMFKAGKRPANAHPVLLGITKASLETESFLSAASFQETTRVLTDAAIKGKRDPLLGLKENVIIGKLIPAGTGMSRYRLTKVVHPELESSTQDAREDELDDDLDEGINQAVAVEK